MNEWYIIIIMKQFIKWNGKLVVLYVKIGHICLLHEKKNPPNCDSANGWQQIGGTYKCRFFSFDIRKRERRCRRAECSDDTWRTSQNYFIDNKPFSWIIIIFGLIVLCLIFNIIYMYYINCYNQSYISKYEHYDSEIQEIKK